MPGRVDQGHEHLPSAEPPRPDGILHDRPTAGEAVLGPQPLGDPVEGAPHVPKAASSVFLTAPAARWRRSARPAASSIAPRTAPLALSKPSSAITRSATAAGVNGVDTSHRRAELRPPWSSPGAGSNTNFG
jgi:hypothetical protein